MAMTKEFIEELRNDLAKVRLHLLQVEPGALATALDDALPNLTLRAAEFPAPGEMLRLSRIGASDRSRTGENVRRLGYELARVRALAHQAKEFFAGRIRILSGQDFSLCYDSHGAPSICAASESINNEKISEKGLVLHG